MFARNIFWNDGETQLSTKTEIPVKKSVNNVQLFFSYLKKLLDAQEATRQLMALLGESTQVRFDK